MTDTLTRAAAPVRAGHEFVYRQDSPFSYLQDRWRAERDSAAAARLKRHGEEMDRLRTAEIARAKRAADSGFEYRFNPGLVTGQGGELVPPAWLIEYFATYPRPARVLANLAVRFPLPAGCQSVNVPRLTTGTINQVVSPNVADADVDVLTAASSSQVVTLSGQADVALQLLELSPAGAHLDVCFFKDMVEAYDFDLESQLLNGLGPATVGPFNQLLGILNVSGINSVTYTAASPTGSGMFPAFGNAAAKIGDNRGLSPEVWLMRTARWAWLMTSEDTALRPFEMPTLNGTTPECPGSLLGWPCWMDNSIPATFGAGANQDVVIACRPSDVLLFEAEPVASAFVEVLSGSLGARLVYRNYAAALTGRFPSSISTIGGTGTVVQSGE
jgi:hypothetical protein